MRAARGAARVPRAGRAARAPRASAARDAREHEDDEEVAQGERHCGRAAQNSMTSARLRLADDVHCKVRLSVSASDVRSRRT